MTRLYIVDSEFPGSVWLTSVGWETLFSALQYWLLPEYTKTITRIVVVVNCTLNYQYVERYRKTLVWVVSRSNFCVLSSTPGLNLVCDGENPIVTKKKTIALESIDPLYDLVCGVFRKLPGNLCAHAEWSWFSHWKRNVGRRVLPSNRKSYSVQLKVFVSASMVNEGVRGNWHTHPSRVVLVSDSIK